MAIDLGYWDFEAPDTEPTMIWCKRHHQGEPARWNGRKYVAECEE